MALYGGIAQLARAFGSYPNGHWFKSSCRYHFFDGSELFRSYSFGPLVKRLRHRPFTAVTGVRFSYGSPQKSTYESKCFFASFRELSAEIWLFVVLLCGFFSLYACGGKDNTERKRGGGDYQRCDGNAACV